MEAHKLQLPELASCLSPSVHRLVIEHTHSEDRDDRVIDAQGLLDFVYICSKLPAPVELEGFSGDPVNYFHDCVKCLAPMFHTVEHHMEGKGAAAVTDCYKHLLSWTGQQQTLLDLWPSLFDGDEVADLLVLLVTTAVLERSLGDVYLIRGPSPCPSMLKDLLLTRELREVLGTDVIQVLRVLIGPPISLNLRNVAWHGFPFPGEIPKRCIWFIVLLVPSIEQILCDKGIQAIIHREPVHLPAMKPVSEVSFVESDCIQWIHNACMSTLVSWDTQPFWKMIVHLFNECRYSYCAALLLFYLEQGLRRVFATVNKCHFRVLTAEATTLYTTFDEILGPYLPDGSRNSVQDILGIPVMEILLDLLMYGDGPRLRDHLSHGELGWLCTSIPREVIQTLLVVTVHVAAMFSKVEDHNMIEVLKQITDDINDYQVQFHRIAVIQTRVQTNAETACNVDSLITFLPDLSQRDPKDPYPLSETHLQIEADIEKLVSLVLQDWKGLQLEEDIAESFSYGGCTQCRQTLDKLISSHKIPTLYRDAQQQTGGVDREGELVSVLQHTVEECGTILTQVCTCATTRQAQLGRKELRSRQRDNFKKFLNSFPSFVLVTNMCGLLVAWQLYYMEKHHFQDDTYYKARIKVWKSVLQFCENLRTFSHPEKNKWTDGLELIGKFVKSFPTDFERTLSLKRNQAYLSSVLI